jgi:MFS family permease
MPRPSPIAAFKHRDFRLYELARLAATLGLQMQSVAVGWQVYDLTKRPLDLGLVGLVQFAPLLLLSLLTGHVADRFDRRAILLVYNAALIACAAALYTLTHLDLLSGTGLWPLYAVLAALGTARAFAGPAAQAYLPSLVPETEFGNAVAWNSSIWQVATVLGPALGGAIYGLAHGQERVYVAFGALVAVSLAALHGIRTRTGRLEPGAPSLARLLAGVKYVRANEVLLGAISLDLCAVLLGGAVALLPAYARDILHAGPLGLGLLRSAPAAGAAVMAVFLPFRRRSSPSSASAPSTWSASSCAARWSSCARPRRCAAASAPSTRCSSARRTSSASSNRESRPNGSASCRRPSPAASARCSSSRSGGGASPSCATPTG